MWYVIGGLAAGFGSLAIVAWLSWREHRKALRQTGPVPQDGQPLSAEETEAWLHLRCEFQAPVPRDLASRERLIEKRIRDAARRQA